MLPKYCSHDHSHEFGDKAFLEVHPDSQDIFFNWETYSKSIFQDEVRGNSIRKDDESDQGSDAAAEGGPSVKVFKIDLSFDIDGFPLLPPITEETMPTFPLLKKYIRAYLTAHYRNSIFRSVRPKH
jgi:hypothetical protein